MKSIPPDLIQLILKGFSAKDLVRFRCVSKFFGSLISCRYSVELHLSHSQTTNTNLYGIPTNLMGHPKQFRLFDLSRSETRPFVLDVNRPSTFESSEFWEVLGSCNGLIALKDKNSREEIIMFWNPFTGKSKKLASSIRDDDFSITSYGFGYGSQIDDDYKLVKISCQESKLIAQFYYLDHRPSIEVTLKLSVYSLKANSWKEIHGDCSFRSRNWTSRLLESGVLAKNAFGNNSLHWLIKDDDGRKIFAFDLVYEEFYYVPLGCIQDDCWMKLSVLDGCLTITCEYEWLVYMWVMKEYGVEQSWIKVLWHRHCREMVPLMYSRDGEKVLFDCYGNGYWHHLKSEKAHCLFDAGGDNGTRKIFTGSLIELDEITSDVGDRSVEEIGQFCSVTKKRRREEEKVETSRDALAFRF